MKKLYFLLFAILFSLLLNAQPYIPFPTDHSQWNNVSTWYDGGQWGTYTSSNYQYIMDGDTIINSIGYKKMYAAYGEEVSEYIGALREDTEKNIYFFPGIQSFNYVNFPSDSSEYLLYTFNNLDVGTVLSINNHNNITVVQIDSVLLGETYHKRYYLTNTAMFDEYWIEGVGSDQELFSAYSSEFEWDLFTLCFKPDSLNTYYINSPDGQDWCIFNVGTNDLEISNFSIYPNPSSESIKISGEMDGNSRYLVSDISGKIILQSNLENDFQISTTKLASGVYSITIISDNKIYSAKFIKL